MTAAKVPAHLSAARRDLFARIAAGYELEPHELELLRLACEALDRCEEARAVLAAEGAYTTDRYGSRRAHPAVSVERDSRIAAARLLRELDLGDGGEA
jgi:P27 family predicted phage terminase small subunit